MFFTLTDATNDNYPPADAVSFTPDYPYCADVTCTGQGGYDDMTLRRTVPRLFHRPTNEIHVHRLYSYNQCDHNHCSEHCHCSDCTCRHEKRDKLRRNFLCQCHIKYVHTAGESHYNGVKCECYPICRFHRKHRRHHRKHNCHHPTRPIVVKRVLAPVRVTASNFDIRRLKSREDSVEIYGRNGYAKLPIKVDEKGRLEVVSKNHTPSVAFSERAFIGLTITDATTVLPLQDTSNKTVYTYSVVNLGSAPITVHLEISPDGNHFKMDSQKQIDAHETAVFVANYFLKYTRVSLRTTSPGDQTTATVYFQAQTLD